MRRLAAAAVALALVAAGCRGEPAATGPKRDLYLITGLPLLFGEGFGLGFAKPDVTRALEDRFTLKPVDLPSQVPAGATLLMAQPRALPAEELVALDAWVRKGGRLVLLADPMLEWPSERGPGDPLRPPVAFADTGLLGHWGLRLDAPDRRGPATVGDLTFNSPGRLVRTGGGCGVDNAGLLARCRLGRGSATVVADADWIDGPQVDRIGGDRGANMAALIALAD